MPRASSLNKGDKIGVFAPSSYVEEQDMEASKAIMESKGYKVFIHPQTYARQGQIAGTTEQKVSALHDLYKDASIKAIFAAGGGNRSSHMFEHLDLELIRNNPKHLIGYSDVSSLINYISSNTGTTSWHSTVFRQIPKYKELDILLSYLGGADFNMSLDSCRIRTQGQARGRLFGGCMYLVQGFLGTDIMDDLNGAILFLEETNEEISKLDRLFRHFKMSGVFERISGLVLGSFEPFLPETGRPFGFTFDEIIETYIKDLGIPVVSDAPFGHNGKLYPFPVGEEVILDTEQNLIRTA